MSVRRANRKVQAPVFVRPKIQISGIIDAILNENHLNYGAFVWILQAFIVHVRLVFGILLLTQV